MKLDNLNRKPLRLWEWREYEKGSLIENGVALNETGTFVWKLCDGKISITRIISAVMEKYDVKKQDAEEDILDLFRLLIEENALKLNP